MVLKRLCQERKLFEIVNSKGGRSLYRPTQKAFSSIRDLSKQNETHEHATKKESNEAKPWKKKYAVNSLEDVILSVLSSHQEYYSLSELYNMEPMLSQFKRSEIITTLLRLVNDEAVIRDLRRNERGAVVTKYRIGR